MGNRRLLGYAVMKSRKTPIPGSGASTHLHILYPTREEAEETARARNAYDSRSVYFVEEAYVEV